MAAAPTPAAAVTLSGAPRVSTAAVHAGLAGEGAETLRALPRPTKGRASGPAVRYPAIKKPTSKPGKKVTKIAKAA
jgi:hypothetical protein